MKSPEYRRFIAAICGLMFAYSSHPPFLMKIDLDRLRLKLRYKILYHLGLTCHDVEHLIDETFATLFADHRLERVSEMSEFAAILNGVCADTIRQYRARSSSAKTMTAWN